MINRVPIVYRVQARNPYAHEMRVSCTVSAPDAQGQVFRLPAWLPGSYLIREFARNFVQVWARDGQGRAVAVTKTDKLTWQCAPASGALTLYADVHCYEFTVRTAYLDPLRGYFNGANLFWLVVGQDHGPCQVELIAPPPPHDHWRAITSLPAPGACPESGWGLYQVENYWELIDHPVEMGEWAARTFPLRGVPHTVAISSNTEHPSRLDWERLLRDVQRLAETQAQWFGGLPTDLRGYVFLLALAPGHSGGLEHKSACSLMCDPAQLPQAHTPSDPDEPYRQLLALISHEYFHLWLVRRIVPAILRAPDFTREQYTRQLWIFEGFTAYYDDLALVRAGVVSTRAYLGLLAECLSRVRQTPGRLRQSIADASFDAWIKLYRPDGNSANAGISYYSKGAWVALALDLTLRRATGGQASLDAVLRRLWQEYGQTGVAVPEGQVEAMASEVCGCDLTDFFARYVYGTEDPPLEDLLAEQGIAVQWRAREDNRLGVALEPARHEAVLKHVFSNGPAQRAGLAPDDEIIAVAHVRVNARTLLPRLAACADGEAVTLHAFRRNTLLAFTLYPVAAPADEARLECLTPSQAVAWLGAEVIP